MFTFPLKIGSNDICESDIQVSASLQLPVENGEQVLHLGMFVRHCMIHTFVSYLCPPFSVPFVLLLLTSDEKGAEHVILTLRVVNRNEPAYEANVFISHPGSLSFVKREPIVSDFTQRCTLI